MVEVICDTSFVIVLANKPVKGMDDLEAKLGRINFVIPSIVINELNKLASSAGMKRSKAAKSALELASNFKTIRLDGTIADDVIAEYVIRNQCIAATIDDALKSKLRRHGIGVITLSHNRMMMV